MATILQLRRGTSTQHASFTGAVGEVTVDTTKGTLVVHDGSTQGGSPLATESYVTSQIQTKDNSDEITEGSTNLYFTNARARGAISVTGSGSYNSSTGVITVTGGVTSVNGETGTVSLDSDDVSEGSANLYFTNARARGAVSAGTGLSYNSSTGEFANTITQYTNSDARGAVSVTDSGGDGSLSYNSTSGVITYTGPSATEVRAHLSAGTGVTYSGGEFSIGQAVGTTSNVTFNDLTVSGNLTVSGTTTTVNTETINLADNLITLNSNETGSPSQNAGIEVERGTSTNVAFQWNETSDIWEYTVDGTNYIPVVGTTATQTLTNKTISGSSNTLSNIGNSSLTNSKVTIGSTDVSLGATVTTFTGLTSVTSTSFVGALTGNASTVTNGVYTTDTGTVTNAMLAGSIANAKLTNSSVTVGTTAIALGASSTTLAGLTSVTSTSFVGALTGNASTVTNGVYTTDTGTVTNAMLAGSIANAKLTNSKVTIGTTDVSLGASSTTLAGLTSVTSTNFTGNLTGNVTGNVTGSAGTVTNGVYTTDTGTVTNTMLAGSIANAKLANSAMTLGGTSVSLGGSYTAQNMLDAIKTVDGSGSGLDADTLDGHDTAYFRINIYDSSGTLLN